MAKKALVTILILVLTCLFTANGCKKKDAPVTPKPSKTVEKVEKAVEKVEKAVEEDVNAVK
jgi:hypothetical protein